MNSRIALVIFTLIFCGLLACNSSKKIKEAEKTTAITTADTLMPFDFVNPFIGTGGHGHTYPGATSPFGMVQLSPDSRLEGWDGCGGYHYSDSILYGFSHTHLQGTGVPDYCDILFMPTNHKIKSADHWNDAYKSKFRHETEKAQPGYYAVHLDDYNIDAEFTTTDRVGIHKYKMAAGDSCRLFIDMMHRDDLRYYDIGTIGDTVVYGYRVSRGWAEEQHCYFYAVFSKPFHDFTQLDIQYDAPSSDGVRRQVLEQVQVFSLRFDPTDEIMVKVGISGTDVEGAKNNMHTEAQHWDFEQYRRDAHKKWDVCLAKAPLKETDHDELAKYYTALYHCYTVPNLWSDVDGRYRGMDKKLHKVVGYNRYTVFSLWDTFRNYHPLMAELEPERTRDWVVTFLEMYKESGHLPIWELAGNETNCMIGYHAVSVIADAYSKNIRNFDTKLALEAMVKTATEYGDDKKIYEEMGYLPSDQFSESVSKTLEYAYDDWCIASFAKEIGNNEVYERFSKRSENWKNVFDMKTSFMRPRKNGGFPEPFDPYEVNFNYTEANAWHYRFFVPHDIKALVDFNGGEPLFCEHVRQLFTATSNTTGREQSDITGLIGQYAQGNEPSHYVPFLLSYCDLNECNRYLDEITDKFYLNSPEGLCGNEDCGQMSAWYIAVKRDKFPFIPGFQNGINIMMREIWMAGGKQNAMGIADLNQQRTIPCPVIRSASASFTNMLNIEIDAQVKDCEIRVEIAEEGKPVKKLIYSKPFSLTSTCKVTAISHHLTLGDSKPSHAQFFKRNNSLELVSVAAYDNQYAAGGKEALIDGVRGSNDFRTGSWQGFHGKDLEAVIDLGKEQAISSVSLSCLEEIKSWIWFPSQVEILISHDGENFANAGVIKNDGLTNDYAAKTKEFSKSLRASGRYVKIVAKPAFESIPEWHEGKGNPVWIFADEITIR